MLVQQQNRDKNVINRKYRYNNNIHKQTNKSMIIRNLILTSVKPKVSEFGARIPSSSNRKNPANKNRFFCFLAFYSAVTSHSIQIRAMSCSATHVTERDGAGTITVSPRNEAKQSGLVLISHGLGDTAEGTSSIINLK